MSDYILHGIVGHPNINSPQFIDDLRHISVQYDCMELDLSAALPSTEQVVEWIAATPKSFLFNIRVFDILCARTIPRKDTASFPEETKKCLQKKPKRMTAFRWEDLTRKAQGAMVNELKTVLHQFRDAGRLGVVIMDFPDSYGPLQDESDDIIYGFFMQMGFWMNLAVSLSLEWFNNGDMFMLHEGIFGHVFDLLDRRRQPSKAGQGYPWNAVSDKHKFLYFRACGLVSKNTELKTVGKLRANVKCPVFIMWSRDLYEENVAMRTVMLKLMGTTDTNFEERRQQGLAMEKGPRELTEEILERHRAADRFNRPAPKVKKATSRPKDAAVRRQEEKDRPAPAGLVQAAQAQTGLVNGANVQEGIGRPTGASKPPATNTAALGEVSGPRSGGTDCATASSGTATTERSTASGRTQYTVTQPPNAAGTSGPLPKKEAKKPPGEPPRQHGAAAAAPATTAQSGAASEFTCHCGLLSCPRSTASRDWQRGAATKLAAAAGRRAARSNGCDCGLVSCGVCMASLLVVLAPPAAGKPARKRTRDGDDEDEDWLHGEEARSALQGGFLSSRSGSEDSDGSVFDEDGGGYGYEATGPLSLDKYYALDAEEREGRFYQRMDTAASLRNVQHVATLAVEHALAHCDLNSTALQLTPEENEHILWSGPRRFGLDDDVVGAAAARGAGAAAEAAPTHGYVPPGQRKRGRPRKYPVAVGQATTSAGSESAEKPGDFPQATPSPWSSYCDQFDESAKTPGDTAATNPTLARLREEIKARTSPATSPSLLPSTSPSLLPSSLPSSLPSTSVATFTAPLPWPAAAAASAAPAPVATVSSVARDDRASCPGSPDSPLPSSGLEIFMYDFKVPEQPVRLAPKSKPAPKKAVPPYRTKPLMSDEQAKAAPVPAPPLPRHLAGVANVCPVPQTTQVEVRSAGTAPARAALGKPSDECPPAGSNAGREPAKAVPAKQCQPAIDQSDTAAANPAVASNENVVKEETVQIEEEKKKKKQFQQSVTRFFLPEPKKPN